VAEELAEGQCCRLKNTTQADDATAGKTRLARQTRPRGITEAGETPSAKNRKPKAEVADFPMPGTVKSGARSRRANGGKAAEAGTATQLDPLRPNA